MNHIKRIEEMFQKGNILYIVYRARETSPNGAPLFRLSYTKDDKEHHGPLLTAERFVKRYPYVSLDFLHGINVSNPEGKPIEECGLKPYTVRRLRDAGIDTVEQLMETPKSAIMEIKGFGKRSYFDLVDTFRSTEYKLSP